MKHRHLEYLQPDVVDDLPSAAIVDLLDRGDLADWHAIAAAIARRPDGELAQCVARLVDAYPMYGTSPLWRAYLDRCRARAEGAVVAVRARLVELRQAGGLTQGEVAARLGISQSDVSKLERRSDWRLSTLAAYLRAIGGRLRVLGVIGGQGFEIEVPLRRRRTSAKRGSRSKVVRRVAPTMSPSRRAR